MLSNCDENIFSYKRAQGLKLWNNFEIYRPELSVDKLIIIANMVDLPRKRNIKQLLIKFKFMIKN